MVTCYYFNKVNVNPQGLEDGDSDDGKYRRILDVLNGVTVRKKREAGKEEKKHRHNKPDKKHRKKEKRKKPVRTYGYDCILEIWRKLNNNNNNRGKKTEKMKKKKNNGNKKRIC